MREFGFERNAALLLAGTQQTVGVPHEQLRQLARGADVLINVSGMLSDAALIEPIPRRLYLDLDPAFIQLWHTLYGIDMRFDAHTHFATVGLGLGASKCPVPDCGKQWIPTFQPVVLEEWPVATRLEYDALTTIANWRGYGSVEFNGEHYGQKAHSLRDFFDLPQRTTERFQLALAIHPEETRDIAALAEHGWGLLDPAHVADTPAKYRRFIQGSKAEFGIAKSGYVRSRCGWFSDRSACYLASGRPVIAQRTGFNERLPTGEGLFEFSTAHDVLTAIDSMNSDYELHSHAARELCESYFDSD